LADKKPDFWSSRTTQHVIMFDWLRNLSKPQEEKRRERLNAYLDDALSPGERQAFERELADNALLRAELAELRGLKAAVRQLPRLTVPRNFTLNPAMVGQPLRSSGPNFYPALRLATVLTAFLLVAVLAFDAFRPGGVGQSVASEVATFSGATEMDDAGDDGDFEAYDAAANTADSDDSVRATTLEVTEVVEGESEIAAEEPSPAEEASTATDEVASAAATPTVAATPIAAATFAGALPGGEAPQLQTTVIPTPTATATATATRVPTPVPAVTPTTETVDDVADGSGSSLTALRLIQISLALLFLVLLVATLRQRRKPR
jgi:hypothetical protein